MQNEHVHNLLSPVYIYSTWCHGTCFFSWDSCCVMKGIKDRKAQRPGNMASFIPCHVLMVKHSIYVYKRTEYCHIWNATVFSTEVAYYMWLGVVHIVSSPGPPPPKAGHGTHCLYLHKIPWKGTNTYSYWSVGSTKTCGQRLSTLQSLWHAGQRESSVVATLQLHVPILYNLMCVYGDSWPRDPSL